MTNHSSISSQGVTVQHQNMDMNMHASLLYTRESQPIHSTCDTAMTNKNWILRDRWPCERVLDAMVMLDASGRSTYLSERSWC